MGERALVVVVAGASTGSPPDGCRPEATCWSSVRVVRGPGNLGTPVTAAPFQSDAAIISCCCDDLLWDVRHVPLL